MEVCLGFAFLLLLGVIAVVFFVIFLSKQKKRPDHSQGVARNLSSQPFTYAYQPLPSAGVSAARPPPSPDSCWVQEGGIVSVAGFTIPGGMIYVGQGLPQVSGQLGIEPALIDPDLPVHMTSEILPLRSMQYWPSYQEIDPIERSVYLWWLTNGRQQPGVDIGYVFLFFYGLERRIIADTKTSAIARGEYHTILAEAHRLLGIYGDNASFNRYVSGLIDLIEVVSATKPLFQDKPPDGFSQGYFPMKFKIGLGQLASQKKPLPAEWAFAWISMHPDTRFRTPVRRCREEFKDLFCKRYREKYREGLIIPRNRTKLRLEYNPASASFGHGTITIDTDLPDPTVASGVVNKLRPISDGCQDDLDALSRLLGQDESARGTLKAAALLPAELSSAIAGKGEVAEFDRFISSSLGTSDASLIRIDDLISLWPSKKKEKLSKREAILLAQFLEKRGIGIEPDARILGSQMKPGGKAIIFQLREGIVHTPSSDYMAASALAHLSALLAGADGVIAHQEEKIMNNHIEKAVGLTRAEVERLRAHVKWLLSDPPSLSSAKKKLSVTTADQRSQVAQLLVAVAGADGVIHPGEVKTLEKIFRALDLNPDDVYGHIHALTASAQAPTEPVTIRKSSHGSSGYALPKPPRPLKIKNEGVVLDMARVQVTIENTAQVSTFLGTIFDEEEDVQRAPAGASEEQTISTLDPSHSALLRHMATKQTWQREELEEAASRFNLILGGALETINDVAFEMADEALCEEDDNIEINQEVLKEMLNGQ